MSVLVDDDDPLVLYNSPGGWAKFGNESSEFDATTHASGTRGDTATLAFEGTSISVYGTLALSLGQSRMNFSVDGVEAGSYIGPQVPAATHNLLFWASPVYLQGSHQLVVTMDQVVPTMNTPNRTFFLDYFVYTTTSAAGKTVLIDDNDRSVTYSDNWQSSDDSDDCLERTNHVSMSAGSWVAVPFNGTQISLISAPGQEGFKASVSIDGSPAGQISQPQNKNKLFNSAVLSPGPHTINVTVLGGNSMAVDYFLVTSGSDALIPAPDPAQAPASESGPSSSSGIATAQNPPPIATIVGGTVGGLVVVAIAVLAFILILRRRAKGRLNRNEPPANYISLAGPRY
ncbi:Right-handed parallel beta-helix repeat-containing protein [Mycena venus]|uniref:Right-handed parallel beta-helix repeat-containing protein n=1 Tax=Mycena venus TaxID=2733690 RepID=A0A8H6X5F0_9AGAR|nr:Right-handed parallel beta-helix repeat-containing protein [Mycena venus]